MNELMENILNDLKALFGLSEEATTVEIHQAVLAAKQSTKDDSILELAKSVSEFAKAEIDLKVANYTEELKAAVDVIVNKQDEDFALLNSKVSELETKLSEIKPDASLEEIEKIKTEFGDQLNEIKATISGGKAPGGDGVTIAKASLKGEPLPKEVDWKIKPRGI